MGMMAKQRKNRSLASILRELDRVACEGDKLSRDLTDQGLFYWLKQGWNKLKEASSQQAVVEPAADDPYQTLGLDPNCIPSDIIYRYRQLAKKFHPDGTEPDEAMFKKVTEAYETICKERNISGRGK